MTLHFTIKRWRFTWKKNQAKLTPFITKLFCSYHFPNINHIKLFISRFNKYEQKQISDHHPANSFHLWRGIFLNQIPLRTLNCVPHSRDYLLPFPSTKRSLESTRPRNCSVLSKNPVPNGEPFSVFHCGDGPHLSSGCLQFGKQNIHWTRSRTRCAAPVTSALLNSSTPERLQTFLAHLGVRGVVLRVPRTAPSERAHIPEGLIKSRYAVECAEATALNPGSIDREEQDRAFED